ncbi:MAG: hypothetical protein HQK56_20945, partial [Deltaproteobacteria bacterium]|nr:hypothetical protein [Deltaproteobacteria bacterium]
MKQLIGTDVGTYVFTASSRTIVLDGVDSGFQLEQLLLITNVTDNTIIYNFADPSMGVTSFTVTPDGTITLVLAYNTTSMSNSDRLQIYVDLPYAQQLVVDPATPLPMGGVDSQGSFRRVKLGVDGGTVLTDAPSLIISTQPMASLATLMNV